MPNALYLGDNLPLLKTLVDGCANLVYLDPPFASQRDYAMQDSPHALAFSDIWRWKEEIWRETESALADEPTRRILTAFVETRRDALTAYLVMMTPRLLELRRVLASDGSLYLHCDPAASHYLKLLLDTLLGPESFRREIVWRSGWVSGFKTRAKNWVRNHDILLYYVRNPRRFTFHTGERVRPHAENYTRRGEPGKTNGIAIDDVWDDPALYSPWIKSFSTEKCGYATQKPLALLDRILRVSSNPGDLVLDPFCGSGTTLLAAHALDRRWIGIDANPVAITLAQSRLADRFQLVSPEGYLRE